MAELISKSAFAVRRGVAASAVSNWIARGKLTGAALTADGDINVEEAERQLGQTVDPGRGAPRPAPSPEPTRAAIPSEPTDAAAASLAAIRLRSEGLKLEAQERQAGLERGELARVDEMKRAWAAELDDLLAATEWFVTELPIKLGLGRDGVDAARREWREFRRRRADQAEATRAA